MLFIEKSSVRECEIHELFQVKFQQEEQIRNHSISKCHHMKISLLAGFKA
jgi:hypothetical protein